MNGDSNCAGGQISVNFKGELFRRAEFPDKRPLVWDVFASSSGRVVFDKREGGELLEYVGGLRADGYRVVSIKDARGRYFQPRWSEVIARAWIGQPAFHGAKVLHKDDDPANNAASNLEWGDEEKNAHDRNQRRRHMPGTASRAKKQVFILHSTYERLAKLFPMKGRRHGDHVDEVINQLLDIAELYRRR